MEKTKKKDHKENSKKSEQEISSAIDSAQADSAPQENSDSAQAVSDESLNQELQKLKEQLSDSSQALMRERADFINFRKRTTQEKADMQVRIAGDFLGDMLPAMDAFDQLFSMREKSRQEGKDFPIEKFFEGIDLIYREIWNVFAQMEFEEINPANQEFDPNFMEALAVEERDDIERETVVQVFQKGFKTKSRVLRPARVVVAKPKQGSLETSQK